MLDRATTIWLFENEKHRVNFKNNASDGKINTSVIKPSISMSDHHLRWNIVNIEKPMRETRRNAPKIMTPTNAPFRLKPLLLNCVRAMDVLSIVWVRMAKLRPYVITDNMNTGNCMRRMAMLWHFKSSIDIFMLIDNFGEFRRFFCKKIFKFLQKVKFKSWVFLFLFVCVN